MLPDSSALGNSPVPEQPLYSLYQDKKRALIPKISSLFLLGIIFFLGILLNLSLLELTPAQKLYAKIVSLLLLLILISVEMYRSFHHAHQPYVFYRHKILFLKKELVYSDIITIAEKTDWIDNYYHTYSLNLGHTFFIKNIPQQLKINEYLQQLIQYSQRSQP